MAANSLSGFGRLYVRGVVLVGLCVLVSAAAETVRALGQSSFGVAWFLLAVLTWVTGSFTVKVPALPATIYVSETFLFALTLLFGPAPAVLTAALDGLFISLRHRSREPIRHLFNIAEPAISLGCAATVFYAITGEPPFAQAPGGNAGPASLILPVLGMGCAYFLFNSGLTAVAVAAETRTSPWVVWRQHLMWLGLNTLGGASLGLVLAVSLPRAALLDAHLLTWSNLGSLGIVLPLLVISFITFRTSVARVQDANHHLAELNKLYMSTVETLAMAIDAKDQTTHGHIRRVQAYAVALARAVGVKSGTDVKAVETAALLHDMGKLAVPESILNKPGKLTAAEYERMKLHAPIGADILSQIEFPYPVAPIVRHHHENWDGTGYPDGLKGAAIPIGARIMSVVDCFDALVTDRPYRAALSVEQATAVLVERRGTMYDPAVVDAFIGIHPRLAAQHAADTVDDRSRIHFPRGPVAEPCDEAHAEDGGPEPGSGDQILLVCQLAEEMGGRTTLHEMAEAIWWHVRRMVPAALAAIYVPDDRSRELVLRHASGTGADRVEGLRIGVGQGVSGWVADNRATLSSSYPALDLGTRLRDVVPPLESALSTPLVTGSRMVGVLTFYAEGQSFSSSDRRLVELVAAVIADPVARALEYEQGREATWKDGRTGLSNAWALARLLTSRALGAMPDRSFGLLCFAVDGQSGVSMAPDVALASFAAASRPVLRSGDLLLRHGENELVILLPDTRREATAGVAGRILAALEGTAAQGLAPSVGLACAPADGRTIDELLLKAHACMEQGSASVRAAQA